MDGYWTVRQSDAHAWTEVWLAGRGWVRVDPTAAVSPGRIGSLQRLQAPRTVLGEALVGMISPSMLARLRAAWEALDNRWTQWVLNYTQDRQLDLLKQLGFSQPNWQDLVRLIGTALLAAMLAGMAWALWERGRTTPWQRLLRLVHRRLAHLGAPLPAHLPPRAIATQVREQFGAPAQPLADWLLQLEQARYAARPQATLKTLRNALRNLPWPEKNIADNALSVGAKSNFHCESSDAGNGSTPCCAASGWVTGRTFTSLARATGVGVGR